MVLQRIMSNWTPVGKASGFFGSKIDSESFEQQKPKPLLMSFSLGLIRSFLIGVQGRCRSVLMKCMVMMDKGLEFDQVDRERNWSSGISLLLTSVNSPPLLSPLSLPF
ncbi:uncharacterized protein LOC120085406 isoform X2 [Benincasa hispida]|uniref:uncharacterized protein LOC120085406 isoform X2 n=1 Tax=Benincasa hispida TaxID=102211 RepID=UPI001900118B|nr:uncharacterized protein LOC120085406 isoform X2 [Benincasa hispida]